MGGLACIVGVGGRDFTTLKFPEKETSIEGERIELFLDGYHEM